MRQPISKPAKHFYSFGTYRLYAADRELFRGPDPVSLTPKAMEALLLLVGQHGHVVDKDHLMKTLWPDTFVEEANLGFQISQLRKALGDNTGGQPYVETIPKRGYRFTAAVTESWKETVVPTGPEAVSPPRARRWLLWVLVGAAVVGSLAWWKLRQPAGQPQLVLTQLTIDSGLTYQPALSPDGKLLAYASDRGGRDLDIWVQMLARGEPIRLTDHEADDAEPSFSPDGTKIVFVSGREGGGIYTVPTLGGEAKRIAALGHGPRFSPDGRSVAYWAGRADSGGPIFVVPSTGGPARQVPEGWTPTRSPLWTPDGRHLLFSGIRNYGSLCDWWVVSLEEGQPVRTGAVDAVRRQGLGPLDNHVNVFPEAWIPGANDVVFSAKSGDSTNLWKVRLSPETWRVVGEPQRLTVGSGLERYPSAASGGRLLFSSLSRNLDVWSLPADTNRATVTGEIVQLTRSSAEDSSPSVSGDGTRMAFESNRTGQLVVWTKDLLTGQERQITETPSAENQPRISRDGSKVAYSIVSYRFGTFDTYVVPFNGGTPEKVCDGCATACDWSPDGQTIIFQKLRPAPPHLGLLNIVTREKAILVQHPKNEIWNGYFSPDGRWVSFGMIVGPGPQHAQFVVPFRDGALGKPQEWVPTSNTKWSADGNRLYGLSRADGFYCIWVQRLDAVSKRMLGPRQALYHFHSARRSLTNVGDPNHVSLSIARDKIVFTLGELTGNIWMAEPRENPTASTTR